MGAVVARAWAGWVRFQEARFRIAVWLAIPGALLWAVQALGAWIQSQEGKWQDKDYLSIGGSTITADNLLTMLALAFLLITGLLTAGAIYLLRGNRSGRYLLLTGACLVVLGQLFAGVLAAIPIDAFYYSAPANVVFVTPLAIFPLLTILCLTPAAQSPAPRAVQDS
ncbi:hypothetical protein NBRGN_082_00150 [Nocardia brasiliensis NBRC 14402]|uniref:hypothetical protein n=1 Tax=Nocardia brasiliensis TaxID=37326 RepID=UPI00030A87F9|nr:hypothetical protein [Nocardia brasiliensis]ASF06387.1 hypothetical protein CEQ30_02445 [Nocardia brasiliensis]GAJ85058.1 hypothetical protein NBRGN_082_00150 [Nocardia brasiliensis NBRC 14402]SUB55726.1 Uncharacterised protein [Nocardia brasiliensis]